MLQIFRSVRFNIVIFSLLALASAVGTLVPQVTENPEKVTRLTQTHPLWARVLEIFHAFDIYHSWWYVALLTLMAFDVVVCKLWKHPPDQGLAQLPEDEDLPDLPQTAQILGKPYRFQRVFLVAPSLLAKTVKDSLKKRRFHIVEHRRDGTLYLEAARHRLQRWGSYISHVSLVLILLGAGAGSFFGFEEFLPIPVGRSAVMKNRPWTIHVDDFQIKYYEGTLTPSLFESTLRIFHDQTLWKQGRIIVNEPLSLQGVKVYQASWGSTGRLQRAVLDVEGRTVALEADHLVRLPGTSWQARMEEFIPDFGIGPEGPFWKSTELKNPGLRLGLYQNGKFVARHWVFMEEIPMLNKIQKGPRMVIKEVDPVLFSGLQVAFNPGYPVIIAGSLFFLFGLCLLFYLHQRRLWILLEPNGSGTSLSMGGWSSRGPRDFERDFQTLVRSWN